MRRALALLMSLVLAMTMFGCSGQTNGNSGGNSNDGGRSAYKIGIAVPRTGSSAAMGERTVNGAQMAVDAFNAAGGVNGVQVELVIQDDQSDPKQSVNIANLFVDDDDILACISGFNSSCVLAATSIYEEAGLVNIACGASSPTISNAGPYTYRMWYTDKIRAAADARVIIDEGYKVTGILYQNDDFGQSAYQIALDMYNAAGIEVPVAEGFILNETKDFNTIITKMMGAGCDSVFLVADESELAAFCTQAAAQGWAPYMSSTGAYNSEVINLGGSAVEELVGNSMWDPKNPPEKVQAYWQEYERIYGTAISDTSSPTTYDTINMLCEIFKNGATTREDVKNALDAITPSNTFPGVITDYYFDENGDVNMPVVNVWIKNGEFYLYNVGYKAADGSSTWSN